MGGGSGHSSCVHVGVVAGIAGDVAEIGSLLVVRTAHSKPSNGNTIELVHLLVGLLVGKIDGDGCSVVGLLGSRGRRGGGSGTRLSGGSSHSINGVRSIGGCFMGLGGGHDLARVRTRLVHVDAARDLGNVTLKVNQLRLEADDVLSQLVVLVLDGLVGFGK